MISILYRTFIFSCTTSSHKPDPVPTQYQFFPHVPYPTRCQNFQPVPPLISAGISVQSVQCECTITATAYSCFIHAKSIPKFDSYMQFKASRNSFWHFIWIVVGVNVSCEHMPKVVF